MRAFRAGHVTLRSTGTAHAPSHLVTVCILCNDVVQSLSINLFFTLRRRMFMNLCSVPALPPPVSVVTYGNVDIHSICLIMIVMCCLKSLSCPLFVQICHSQVTTNLFLFVLFLYFLCVIMFVCRILIKITYIHAYIHTYIHTYLLTYLLTYLPPTRSLSCI